MEMYKVFQYSIQSNIELPELTTCKKSRSDITFTLRRGQTPVSPAKNWLHHWRNDAGSISISYGRTDNCHYLRFPLIADFCISKDGRQIESFWLKKTEPEQVAVRHFLLDQVIPRLVHHFYHKSTLHGLGVFWGKTGLCFLGDSGCGKSTLAAAFLTRDYDLLSDDCLLLELEEDRVSMTGCYPSLRLWSDSFHRVSLDNSTVSPPVPEDSSLKKRLLPDKAKFGRQTKYSTQAIFFLDSPRTHSDVTEVSIQQLSGAQVVKRFIECSFLLDVGDFDRIQAQLERLAALAGAPVPFYLLSYPRKYDVLADVCSEVEETVSAAKIRK